MIEELPVPEIAMLTTILEKKPQLLDEPRFQQAVLKANELSHGELEKFGQTTAGP